MLSPAAPLVEQLAEHLDTGDRGLLGRAETDDLHFLADLDDPLLHLAGDHRATTGDRHHVLHRHEEGLLHIALGLGDVAVDGLHQLADLAGPLRIALEGLQGADPDDRGVVAGELVLVEQLADLELNQVEELLVVDGVRLVQRHHDVGHADLPGEQHVLAGLGHRAVRSGHHEDRAVHLGRTGDHVLDVVGVSGHVDVRVVPVRRLVLDVRDRDGDAALLLFGRLVDLVERRELGGRVGIVQHLGDGRGERGLAVVDVSHRPHVHVWLRALELLLGHGSGNAPGLGRNPLGSATTEAAPPSSPLFLRCWLLFGAGCSLLPVLRCCR